MKCKREKTEERPGAGGNVQRALIRSASRVAVRLPFLLTGLLGVAVAWGQDFSGTGVRGGDSVEDFIKSVTLYLARFVELVAAAVIGIASLRGVAAYFRNLVRPAGGAVPRDEIRLSLGRSLALALEFELGADILKTAVAPTWNDIGQLAAIAVLRTALNYFLERELGQAKERGSAP